MKTDIAVIVQCRISSKRLPEKALKTLGGRTVLEWTLLSMNKVKADKYFVATDENSYETLKPIVEKCGWEIFVGPLDDVLKRYCLLIEKIKCKYVLRATADNPFLFYEAESEHPRLPCVGALRKHASGMFLASDRSGYAARRELSGAVKNLLIFD